MRPRPTTFIKAALCLAIVAIVGPMWGCVDDIVKVDVPREVQKATGAPARVPLSQSRALAEEWKDMQLEAAAAAAAKERAAREEAARVLAEVRTKIEDEAQSRAAEDARWAATAERELRQLDSREGARAAMASADLDRLTRTIEATAKRFDASIAAADAQAASFGGLIGQGLGLAQGAASTSGIPLVPGLLAVVGALFLRRPGDAKKLEEATQKVEAATKKADEEWRHGFNVGAIVDRSAAKGTVMDPASTLEPIARAA